jgi:hypothetical protein
MTLLRCGVLFVLLSGAACAGSPAEESIALGAPSDSAGVKRAERMTDGHRALEGAPWNADSAALFSGPRAFVVYDLGGVTPIEAAYLQGDNNDTFVLEVSDDGARYTHLWTAPSVGGNGLRIRASSRLEARGRFIRVRAKGGDRWVSLSELQLFSTMPSVWPPRVPIDFEPTASHWAQLAILGFGLLAILAVAFDRRSSAASRMLWTFCSAAALVAIFTMTRAPWGDPAVINLSRAIAASVACAVVLKLGTQRRHEHTKLLTSLLGAMALLALASFYNFGHPQFYDSAKGAQTYVHGWDMRVYFPAAKYFDELGYDGVYLASLKAYSEEELDGQLEPIANVEVRDLRDYQMRTVDDLRDEIQGVDGRFSAKRWAEFKRDMSYFWSSMGRRAYLDSLRDHGGNATPAWLLVAYLIYGSAEAEESTLLVGAILDPLLLLLLFVTIGRTFGLRAALVCMVAYGATTVYQFGSNWGGSTLRNDWMVLIGLGVCALKRHRWTLAGILLGWAAMIRAFPALALLFLAAPIGWKMLSSLRRGEGGADSVKELKPLLELGAGVLVVVLALGAASTAVFGWEESWGAWSEKIAMHANRPNVNHLGIRALVSYDADNLWGALRARGEDPELWGPRTAETMRDRGWLILLGMLFYTALAIRACRNLRLSDAALIGTMMIPVYLYPSNYYLHVAFLWPLCLAAWPSGARDAEWTWIAAIVLGTCAIEWFSWLFPGNYGRFLFLSGVLLVAIATMLVIPILGDRRRFATSGTA